VKGEKKNREGCGIHARIHEEKLIASLLTGYFSETFRVRPWPFVVLLFAFHFARIPFTLGPALPGRVRASETQESSMAEYREYLCAVCGFVYREADGLPEEGFPPGTRWADIPENWVCPECGATKEEFEMVEI
jgi:rubredoxin